MTYEIKLDIFEGPLDLLLYLIKKNEIDIYNIPIATITEQYLQHIEVMKSFNLDIAGEYLVMASTLILIKSKVLLPIEQSEEGDAEGEVADPRAELVQQLLEYRAFKEVALNLDQRNVLGRDVFKRGSHTEGEPEQDEDIAMELGIFDLIEAFRKVLSTIRKEDIMEIDIERISLADRINEIMEQLQMSKEITFEDLLGNITSRKKIIYTLLAILELMKLRVLRAFQVNPFGTIRVSLRVEEATLPEGADELQS
jgi:segregation and condensation protein A